MLDMLDILRAARRHNASDVILSAGVPPTYRVDGVLVATKGSPLPAQTLQGLLYTLLSSGQVEEFEREKELDFAFTLDGEDRFRANLSIQRGSIAAAFRLLAREIPSLEDLHLPGLIGELALSPQGLILVTGPTGHGKSTTQAAMIDLVNLQRRAHVITIEDPIEYVHENKNSVIEQREVGTDTQSFSHALRHVLRQTPDVILIGEMRDAESISCALTAAETGHLVIATLHTNDSVQAIDRLLDVFPPHQQSQVRSQLSLSLLAVFAQRLVPKTGDRGRIPAVEILRITAGVAHLIRDQKVHQIYSMMETHGKEGMKTMDSSLKELYMKGEISHEDARSRMRNPMLLDLGR